ncbi:ABC transporter permease [Amygdalobacter nucleatus]|uniref:ABC transporter, permease protein n=1 Tax=Amygdalobacter nucleatus TaxID=3029274 RepID=A0A133YGZ7_9FIRM|nr:ABC transporter permease [Amygdalobacter nucleatus]KXB42462.1 ABC transporter, permease protein [Amygdalobacter nucleatus]MDF0486036.1 ABC transporter permease [Amygdalobacter nucleatus]
MKKYILTRLLKSIVAVFVVVAIVVTMVYTLIPRSNIFAKDTVITKLTGNQLYLYKMNVLKELGYQTMYTQAEMCSIKSKNFEECKKAGSEESKRVIAEFAKEGYTIHELDYADSMQGQVVAYREYRAYELILRYLSKLIVVDNIYKVNDPNNKDLKRSYSLGGNAGNWGLICSGCEYKYQLYFNKQFPFIHQNIIRLNFGKSYPSFSGIDTLEVISTRQGKNKPFKQVLPSGKEMSSPILQDTCRYKYTLDELDKAKFSDNYADCRLAYDSPSMIETSYIFGVLALILAYLIAIPAGISMARNKGKLQDKIGIVYINLLIAIPSLAFIFLMKFFGHKLGLPDLFPQLGFGNIKSYIMPIVILALMMTPGIMMWLRRYMIDQSNSDYVKFAKSKGLSKKEIFRNHILKNAIIPFVNGLPSSVILAISGAVITESVFSIPGMGKMLPDAITAANNNMIITLTFIFTSLSIFSVMLGDVLMTIVDPRISLDTKKGE